MTEPDSDKTCFVDPVTGRSVSYGQFVADVANWAPAPFADQTQPRSNAGSDTGNSPYETLLQIVANLAQGNDFSLEQGRVWVGENGKRWDGVVEQVDGPKGVGPVEGPVKLQDEDGPVEGPVASAMPLNKLALNKLALNGLAMEGLKRSQSRIRLATSGTTGKPKWVMHTVESLTRGVRLGNHHADDVWGLAYPLDHLAGLQVLFQALFNQNTIVQLFGLPTDSIHQAIEEHNITHLSCTPTFLKLLDSQTDIHPEVQRLTTGGERCDPATLTAIKRVFPSARHRNIYALTEVGNLLVAEGDQFSVPEPLHNKITVIDGSLAIHRSLLADPSIGKLATSEDDDRSIRGQRDQPNQSDAELSGEPDSQPISARSSDDEYFLTGDLVEVLNEQPLRFKFAARRDDVINVGGYKVTPQHVEQCLINLPEIRQAVVYGQKNSVTGEIVVCDVVVEAGRELNVIETKQALASVLPRYAVPRMINVVESLRMTESGKLCRRTKTS